MVPSTTASTIPSVEGRQPLGLVQRPKYLGYTYPDLGHGCPTQNATPQTPIRWIASLHEIQTPDSQAHAIREGGASSIETVGFRFSEQNPQSFEQTTGQ